MEKPFSQSFRVYDGLLFAGCYPGDLDPAERDHKLRGLLDCGILRVINLMEADETSGGRAFNPYAPRLQALAADCGMTVECLRLPIKDASAPTPSVMRQILDTLDEGMARQMPTYLHCWGGHGRTSTVVGCHLIRHGRTATQAIEQIGRWRAALPKHPDPFENGQKAFVESWSEHDPAILKGQQ